MALQRSAGNQAVVRLLRDWRDGTVAAGQIGGRNERMVAPPRVASAAGPGTKPIAIQRSIITDLVGGFFRNAGVRGAGELGAYLAGPMLEEAQRAAAPLAEKAVQEFLKTPEGKQALALAVAAQVGHEVAGEGSKLLGEQLRLLYSRKIDAVKATLRAELETAGKYIQGLTPDMVNSAWAHIEAQLEKAKDNEIARQAERAASSLTNAVAPIASALAQGFASYGIKWAVDFAIDLFVNGKDAVSMAGNVAVAAIKDSASYKDALKWLDRAGTVQRAVSTAFGFAQGIVDTAEGFVLSFVPTSIKDFAASAYDTATSYLPRGEAMDAIKPQMPGATKRAGGYVADKGADMVFGQDGMSAAKEKVAEVLQTGAKAGTKAAKDATAEATSGLPSAATFVKGAQVLHSMTDAETGKEAEKLGESAADVAVASGGLAAGTALGTAAAVLAPAVLAPALPFILGAAGAAYASQSETGKRFSKATGEVAGALTALPVAGMALQKGAQVIATGAATLGWLLRSIQPTRLGGSDDLVKASKQNMGDKASSLASGWTVTNLFKGANADVIDGIAKRIVEASGHGGTIQIDVSNEKRATARLAKDAMLDVYYRARTADVLDRIVEIVVTGKGFEARMKPENVNWDIGAQGGADQA